MIENNNINLEDLIDTTSFEDFCNSINKGFESINNLMCFIETKNKNIIDIIENGR